MSRASKINGWRCKRCGRHTYAVHVDDGVTPMFLACRAVGVCKGTAVSLMYPAPPAPEQIVEEVAWEWYKPTPRATRRLDRETREYVEKGGLILRELTDAGREALKAKGVPA
jgi:hypothetical protein